MENIIRNIARGAIVAVAVFTAAAVVWLWFYAKVGGVIYTVSDGHGVHSGDLLGFVMLAVSAMIIALLADLAKVRR